MNVQLYVKLETIQGYKILKPPKELCHLNILPSEQCLCVYVCTLYVCNIITLNHFTLLSGRPASWLPVL